MDNAPVVKQILDFIPTIDFSTTFQEVSLFETTIRYLGGLISAYDLLTGPKADLAKGNEAGVKALLDQAVRLADILKIAFDTPSGIPDNSLFFDPDPRIAGSTTNFIATIGTLVLEWTRLSDITGNPEYGELTQRAEQHLLRPRPSWGEPFPGLIGMEVDVATGEFVSAFGGWVGGADSFFEYLIKMFLYDPKRFAEYRDRWVLAADSSIKHLASHPTTRPDLTFLAMYSDQKRIFSSQHRE